MNIYFSEIIRRLRKERGITQEALADYLGVSFQAVSKWERGESYPDIETLPEIASYFSVSVDDLLGVNRAEKEKEILGIMEEYDNLTDEKLKHEIITNAIEKYPNDFRLKLRQMEDLAFGNGGKDYEEYLDKIRAIYTNIQSNCTVDSIRISAKRILASYYRILSDFENSGVTYADSEKIICEMPVMRNGREYLLSCLYPYDTPERKKYTMDALEEEICLLCTGISHLFEVPDETNDVDWLIYGNLAEIEMLNLFYEDGNYGRAWKDMIYSCGYLGLLYAKKGDYENGIKYLAKEAELAKRFDALDRITVMHSRFFEGREFDKHKLGSNYSAVSRVKYLIEEKYPLPDEFRKLPGYREIIDSLCTD